MRLHFVDITISNLDGLVKDQNPSKRRSSAKGNSGGSFVFQKRGKTIWITALTNGLRESTPHLIGLGGFSQAGA